MGRRNIAQVADTALSTNLTGCAPDSHTEYDRPELKDNQANINDLPNLRCQGHSLSSCMLLKSLIYGENMQELMTYLAHYYTGS